MRKYTFIIMAVLTALVLGACGAGTEEPGNDLVVDDNNVGDSEELVEKDGEGLNDESGNTNKDLITETGIYNGQADPHTIELETAEGPLAFQLTMEARDDIEALIEGKKVTYTYTEDNDTRIIESIERID
jgi:hypothetical protein